MPYGNHAGARERADLRPHPPKFLSSFSCIARSQGDTPYNGKDRECSTLKHSKDRVTRIMAFVFKTVGLFIVTAIAEIVGCYLPYLWLKERASAFALIPAALSLATFAWLLSLHPGAAGRTYAAYGGIYVSVALVWLWVIDGQKLDRWDVIGVAITLIGMSTIAFAPRLK